MQQLIRFAALALAALLATFAAPASAQETAEGQSKADYLAWLSRDPDARAQVLSFKAYLGAADVAGVVPTWQLVRTASKWRECGGPRFEVAPTSEWTHIAATLSFVKAEVEPVIGRVEAVSGFRNEELNHCAGGAPASAHRHFYALDLVPADEDLARGALIRDVCRIHQSGGRRFDIGLGFYTGNRFHLDSKGFRRWGADGNGATSPCATGNYA
ncbi:MAG TPA: D-Ala-D-Ala carboxypeptidase family metallohydrolase [Allosphingosinicella sp.]|nr:D-Ala-D-Ala carboxypeptidase family metallohydrolase [Allosphingosinicella sp.]